MPFEWSDDDIEQTANRFKAIAQPLRLAIVCLLAQGELSVGEICAAMGTTQPNISQHLAHLRREKLLKSRKENNRVYYAISDDRLMDIMGILQSIYCPELPAQNGSSACAAGG